MLLEIGLQFQKVLKPEQDQALFLLAGEVNQVLGHVRRCRSRGMMSPSARHSSGRDVEGLEAV